MWLPLAVALGEVPGHSLEFKFGYNSAVSSTEETIWFAGGVYAYPAAATVMTVSSDDANDTSDGTGARTVEIFGLDGNYEKASETITLSGLTEVSTTNSYLRVFRAIVRSSGSGNTNAGQIYVGTGTVTLGVPANIYTTIGDIEGQTLQALYTVPANHTAYMYQLSASMFGNANVFVTVRLMMREFGEILVTKDKFTVSRGEVLVPHDWPVKIPEKTDIEVRGKSSGADVDCSAAFGLVLVQDGFEQKYLLD